MSETGESSPWNIIKNPVSGRARISQACDRCRARKIKCSGKSDTSPRCTNCEKDGFQCVVSDKLTRNSFPKGYTKGLELRLLDVELQRNRLVLEIAELKKALASSGSADVLSAIQQQFESGPVDLTVTTTSSSAGLAGQKLQKSSAATPTTPTTSATMATTINQSSSSHTAECNNQGKNVTRTIHTDSQGLVLLDQNILSPFDTFMKLLNKSTTFNGYEATDAASSRPKSGTAYDLPEDIKTHLFKYHMNLNRYLNLILYKLILPLFNFSATSNAQGSNKNLDHLIWIFFNDYNKLIPILDFELFYNDYLNFVTTYTAQNSTYQENGETKRKYFEFNLKEQDLMMKLILILKFTIGQPKTTGQLDSLLFPNKLSPNQLNESFKLINTKHLICMFKNCNFTIDPNLDKLEISLLTFYYLVKFENYNLHHFTDNNHTNVPFLRDIINLSTQLVLNLNIDKSDKVVMLKKQSQEQLIKIQRLKLYWDYKILIKLAQIYFNISLEVRENVDEPQSIETIKLINSDIQITLALINLLKLIPTNIMSLVMENDQSTLDVIDAQLQQWKDEISNIQTNDDNNGVFKKLYSYYAYFKVLINLCKSIEGSFYAEYVTLVYDLTFNNSKNPNKVNAVSLETAESLCLHSFNFHLVSLISIIKLKNIKNLDLKSKITNLVQLYQIIIKMKDMDPVFQKMINYIVESTPFGVPHPDLDIINDEALQLFSEISTTSGSTKGDKLSTGHQDPQIFKKRDQSRNSISFDLNAFSLPGDNCYSQDGDRKRRKSNSSTMSSTMSRESSTCSPSRRLSVTSSDGGNGNGNGVPSLFASAASPYPRSSRMRSMSNDSRIRDVSRQNSVKGRRESVTNSHTDDMPPTTDESDSNRSSVCIPAAGRVRNSSNSTTNNSFSKDTSTLPTILSEGNLTKSMNALNSMTAVEPMDIDIKEEDELDHGDTINKAQFDADDLFQNSLSNGMSHSISKLDLTNLTDSKLNLLDLGSTSKLNLTDLVDLDNVDLNLLKKSPMDVTGANVYTPSPSTSFNPASIDTTAENKQNSMGQLIDDGDLSRLREHVNNLKTTTN